MKRCSESPSRSSQSERVVVLDTYYYLHPRRLSALRLSGRVVLFLERQQLGAIQMALTEKCPRVLSTLEERLMRARSLKCYRLILHAGDEEELAAILFLASAFSKVPLGSLLRARERRLKFTAERIEFLRRRAPWAKRDPVKDFVVRVVSELAGADVRLEAVRAERREAVEQLQRDVSRELCSVSCPRRRSSPDNEDLRLALAVRRISWPVDVYVIPREGECLGCVLDHKASSDDAYSHVRVIRPRMVPGA